MNDDQPNLEPNVDPDKPRGQDLSRWYFLGGIAFVAAVYLATLAYLPKDGFWIVDNGCKFIQMQSVIRSDYQDFSIRWPGIEVDPDFEFSPLPDRFGHVIDGKLYGTFAPFFPLVSSFGFRAWGFAGLYVIPILGGLLTLTAVWKIARVLTSEQAELKFAPLVAILLAGLTTPMWFYSVAFWEHTPATGLACWGMAFFLIQLKDRRPVWSVLAGLACAGAVYFRDDLYVFAAIMAISYVVVDRRKWHRGIVFCVVAFVGLIPLWWFQWKTLGNPLGLHFTLAESGTIDVGRFLSDRWLVLRHLFVDAGSWPLGSFLFSLPILWLWFWYLGTNRGTTVKRFSCMAAIVLLGGGLILYCQVFAISPPRWLLGSNSLFTACPLLVLAFLKPRDRNGATSNAGARLAAISVRMMLAYAAAYALLTPEMHSRGVHWGCRYLLTIYPILIAVASIHIVGWWRQTRGAHTPTRSILLGLVVISFFAQLHSVRLMGQMKSFWVQLNEAVTENSHEAIIATAWWIPMELSNCFEDKSIFLVRSQAELLKLRRNLRTAGTRNATILYSPPRPNAEQMGNTVVSDELHMFAVELDSARSP